MTRVEPYYQHNGVTIYHADCLEAMAALPPASIDAVICDPPYGTTACAWDSPIPFAPMWAALKRLIRPRAPIVLFGSQPFTSALVMSNLEMFKYQCIWCKSKSRIANYAMVKDMPGKVHEDITVFSGANLAHNSAVKMTYNPQGAVRINKPIVYDYGGSKGGAHLPNRKPQKIPSVQEFMNYPTTIIDIPSETLLIHPTQKPVALMAYLILTYTDPGACVLDFTCGSGTTLRAAKNLGRRAIGIEIEERYADIAARRLSQEVMELAV